MAEIMWLTGMRCAEVCALPLLVLPENPAAIERETVVKITGKGQSDEQCCSRPACCARLIGTFIRNDGGTCELADGTVSLSSWARRKTAATLGRQQGVPYQLQANRAEDMAPPPSPLPQR